MAHMTWRQFVEFVLTPVLKEHNRRRLTLNLTLLRFHYPHTAHGLFEAATFTVEMNKLLDKLERLEKPKYEI